MNALTATKPTRLDQIRMEILPPDRERSFYAGMPAHVKPERFMRNLDIALMQNADLMQCDPRLIFREVSKAAALGLYLDPQLGEAYLIVGWNGKAKRKEPQLRIGYRGLIKLGRQSGEISQIYAHEVHANDKFKASLGDDKKLVHEPDIFGDRGEIVGYYAVVKYKDGDSDFEPLTIAQAHTIRNRSDGWKAFKAEKIKSTPWSTDEVEMSKKTAIRRLTKRIPQSPELAEALRIEDAAEHADSVAIAAPTPPRPPAPPSAQISAPRPPQDEIIDVADASESEASDALEDGESEATDAEIVDEETGEVGESKTSSLSEAEDRQIDFLNRLDTSLANCTTADEIVQVWNDFDALATFDGNDDAISAAKSFKRKHTERVRKNG